MKFSKRSKVYEIQTDHYGYRGVRVVQCIRSKNTFGQASVDWYGMTGGGFSMSWKEFCDWYNPKVVGKIDCDPLVSW